MEKEKFNIIVFSGDLDKVLAAFILATTSASMGMEVRMFFTFWGLNVLRKKKFMSGKNILQKLMSLMNRGGAERLPLSKFNMLGIGPAMMKILMRQSKVPTITDFIAMSKEMGIKLIACTTTLAFMGYDKSDFIDGLDSFAGAAAYLAEARECKISYFI
jgi:peroxiredoxin family protein